MRSPNLMCHLELVERSRRLGPRGDEVAASSGCKHRSSAAGQAEISRLRSKRHAEEVGDLVPSRRGDEILRQAQDDTWRGMPTRTVVVAKRRVHEALRAAEQNGAGARWCRSESGATAPRSFDHLAGFCQANCSSCGHFTPRCSSGMVAHGWSGLSGRRGRTSPSTMVSVLTSCTLPRRPFISTSRKT